MKKGHGNKTDVKAENEEKRSRYAMPALIAAVFLMGVFMTNTVDRSISGAAVASVTTDYGKMLSDCEAGTGSAVMAMEADRAQLLAEKAALEKEAEGLQARGDTLDTQISLYSGILAALGSEKPETINTPYSFRIKYDKYVIAQPRKANVWSAEIENTGILPKSYTLSLRLKSAYNDAFGSGPGTAGTLTLSSLSSGSLNVVLEPESEGYGIFGLYVNGNYAGDLVVFAF